MPTPEEVLARQLRAYPQRTDMANIEEVSGRPDINALYGKLGAIQGAAPDYSGIAEVARARRDQGKNDWLAGFALSTMGGQDARPLGQALAAQGLEQSKPMRANAADVGYFNPQTDEFVENPALRQSRDEKVILSRIDALTKEQESRARIAVSQGNSKDAQARMANADALRQLAISLVAQGQENARVLGEERNRINDKKADKATAAKPLPSAQAKAWTENRVALTKVDEALQAAAANKDAFGLHNYLSGAITQRIDRKGYKDGVNARAKVADLGSLRIHDRSGAAVTAAEFPRLRPFIPSDTDEYEVVQQKLENFKREYELINQEISQYAEDMGYIVPGRSKGAEPSGASGSFGDVKLPSQDAIAAELARRQQ